MNKITLCAAFLSLAATVTCQAQTSQSTATAPTAVYAAAKGNDTYLLFSGDTYKADKKYTVVKFWSEKEPLSATEEKELAYLKKHLAKKQVEVIAFQWKSEADLKAALAQYPMSVQVEHEKRIRLKGDNFTLNTTSGKALFVMEENKPFSLCSGSDCEARLKTFFKTRSFD